MNNTAIEQKKQSDALLSRYADTNISTSSQPDSLANIFVNGYMIVQPYAIVRHNQPTIPSPEITESPLVLDRTDFEFFLNVMNEPQQPSSSLRNLLEGND